MTIRILYKYNGGRKSGERGEEDGNGGGSRTRGADGKGKLLPLGQLRCAIPLHFINFSGLMDLFVNQSILFIHTYMA